MTKYANRKGDEMRPLRVGDVIYDYCGGAFGRDGYGPKRVEAIGADWVVVRHEDGAINFATFPFYNLHSPDDLIQYTTEEARKANEG